MPAGRPIKIEGACLINCTIPVSLRDFLKEHGINRSELFRKAAMQMYKHQICPKCYSYDIADTYKGKICRNCDKWLVQKECPICEIPYTPDRHGTPYQDKIICNDCFKIGEKEVNEWYEKELSKVNRDDE